MLRGAQPDEGRAHERRLTRRESRATVLRFECASFRVPRWRRQRREVVLLPGQCAATMHNLQRLTRV